jgi:hypothetical protein
VTTKMYFSGEFELENYIRENPKDFEHCNVMLTYWTIRFSGTGKAARRLRCLIKNKPYKPGKKKGDKVLP